MVCDVRCGAARDELLSETTSHVFDGDRRDRNAHVSYRSSDLDFDRAILEIGHEALCNALELEEPLEEQYSPPCTIPDKPKANKRTSFESSRARNVRGNFIGVDALRTIRFDSRDDVIVAATGPNARIFVVQRSDE